MEDKHVILPQFNNLFGFQEVLLPFNVLSILYSTTVFFFLFIFPQLYEKPTLPN